MNRSWLYFRILQIIVDFLLILSAFILAYFLKVGFIFSTNFDFWNYFYFALISTGFWILFLIFAKYYRIPPRSGKRVLFDVFLIFLGAVIGISFLLVIFFFRDQTFFSRQINLNIFLLGGLFLLISQFIFRWFLRLLKKQEKNVYQTLIIGANRVAEKLILAVEKNPYAPYKIVGVIDPYGISKKVKGSSILGKLNKLETVCDEKKITAIIQCDAFEHTLNLISLCEEKNIKFQFDPALRGIFEKNLRIREVAGQTMISFVKRDFDSKNKTFFYRVIDSILRQVFDID